MPTISIFKHDFESLIFGYSHSRKTMALDQIEEWLMLVKGELKGHNAETGELRIELQDSNRPDLWCCEGIARQIRTKQKGRPGPYPFLKRRTSVSRKIHVAAGLRTVRPFIAACTAKGYRVTAEGLAQLIQTQEKLADIFGRKRKTLSIGLYRLANIRFPVTYTLVNPDQARFTPLGMETVMTLSEILMVHPKGIEHGHILQGHDRVPLLHDANEQALSFPPIINSREIGEIQVGDEELFVEVTGMDLPMVMLTLNILAANLSDRGAAIEPVEIRYPSKTAVGKSVLTPQDLGRPLVLPVKTIEQSLGQPLGGPAVKKALEVYGYDVQVRNGKVKAKLPPFRQDLLHAMDVVEDVAISRGYADFLPVMPSQFTVGGLSQIEQLSDRSRELMVGMGFQEIISNILGSPNAYRDSMRLAGTEWGRMVEVDNTMSISFSCLRQWMIPSLLRVEAASNRAFYPHRMFESGEVAIPDDSHEVGSVTATVLGAVMAHAAAHFSEIHSCLDTLLYHLDRPYTLQPLAHPSFLDGRAGRILLEEMPVGLIGELHPEVLERWQIGVPVVAFEINLSRLLSAAGR
ncbi:Phenylalanyl-tRNA synthetase beta chain [Nitrospira sp. KM1]|uniref:phenylalanine--tRNA ligase subunit beta n=1 Tax=Nitrospira sp. KM1 TaxID=1936990 RepID=UPI0013A777F7|nr:phenylalanine--tRNA ligase subunit beta [Nitrospira sp. KM1]BCA55538.1 Phenylalanyl-tRNA synthetase beta chain [Nitrospira sp. KM1]